MPRHPTGRGAEQFVIRMPDGMRERLREASEANKRSMNAEIIARLEDSFRANQAADIKVDAASEVLTAVLARVASDMQARGAAPSEFVAWMDQFPPFSRFLRDAGLVKGKSN